MANANVKIRGKNGGPRPGSGRPPGPRPIPQSLRERFPIMPLEHMLAVLNDKRQSKSRRDDMAKAAAPFVHARVAPRAKAEGDGNIQTSSIDVTKLTDEELAFFERIMAKAAVMVTLDSDDPDDAELINVKPSGRRDN
jgi:hypothetical protein